MLPNNNSLLNSNISIKQMPSYTHFMDLKQNKMVGMTDGITALKQAIFLILSIERYDFVIYSWNYGIQLKDLFGKSTAYVCAILPARIKQALMQDDRIKNVYNFIVESEQDTVSAKFTVDSIFGTFQEGVQYHV